MELEFTHKPSAHCENGVIANMLRFYGFDISEPMIFGLASGIFFSYMPFVKLAGLEVTSFRTFPGVLFSRVAKLLGFKIHTKRYLREEKAMEDMEKVLKSGRPVGCVVGMYYLPYMPFEYRFHFNGHNICIIGKNEETGEEKMTTIEHKARIITHVDEKMQGKAKIIRLLTNDLETEYEEIVTIYKARWAIELLFKQIKQNFPLRYFYGESANAIKIQVWVTLIANLIITLLQKGISRSWSFSGLATIVRIMLMYYININGFLEHPEKDWEEALAEVVEEPPEPIEDKN